MMDCRLVQKHLSAFVDAELEPTPMLEVEDHLVRCESCASTYDFFCALKSEVKACCAPHEAPHALRLRVQAALSDVRPVSSERGEGGQVWMTLAAVAASVLLVFGSVVGTDAPHAVRPQQASMAPIDVVRDVVDRHKDELPTEIQTAVPAQATSWFRDKLGFRVRSVEFAEPKVHFLGARVSQVGTHQAAKLYYSVGDSRLTVVMFKAPPRLADALSSESESEMARLGLRRTRVGERVVTYQTLQGYTVPILHDNGLVYAFTGDLDQSSLLRLVASARIPH